MPKKEVLHNSLDEVMPLLVEFNNKGCSHYTYAIVVRNPDGMVQIYERRGEPCYGGLRKYKSTHNDATQPEGKPGDLNNPFPKVGEPIAIAFPFESLGQEKYSILVDYVWGNESPWIRGFGSTDNVVRTYNKDKLSGMILINTDIDPTVLVNLCKFTYSNIHSKINKFNSLLEEGLTPFEALCCVTLDSSIGYSPMGGDTYMFPQKAGLKAMKEGKSNDFTGGTFRERFDYSRKNIQDIFADKVDGITLAAEMLKATNGPWDKKNYAEIAKKVIRKYV